MAGKPPKPVEGRPGTEVWEIPQDKLDAYNQRLEELGERVIDLDAQLQKDKTKIQREVDILLNDLAAAAKVPIGTPAAVQGRYFIESRESSQPSQVIRR